MRFEKYPDRPNGGKWIAMGSRYPANYDYDNPSYERGKYYISGESQTRHLVDCVGMTKLDLVLCDTTHCLAIHSSVCGISLKRRMTDVEIVQMLYAIHSGKEENLPLINAGCFEIR